MKKVAVFASACMLFVSFTFAQTPKTQTNAKAPAKSEATTKKDSKDCSKTCTHKDAGCCKKGGETKSPEKK